MDLFLDASFEGSKRWSRKGPKKVCDGRTPPPDGHRTPDTLRPTNPESDIDLEVPLACSETGARANLFSSSERSERDLLEAFEPPPKILHEPRPDPAAEFGTVLAHHVFHFPSPMV